MANLFDVTTTTISRIKHKENHVNIIEEYENLPLEERKAIYDIFCKSIEFEELKAHKTILQFKRKLTQEQVFLIYANEEF